MSCHCATRTRWPACTALLTACVTLRCVSWQLHASLDATSVYHLVVPFPGTAKSAEGFLTALIVDMFHKVGFEWEYAVTDGDASVKAIFDAGQ